MSEDVDTSSGTDERDALVTEGKTSEECGISATRRCTGFAVLELMKKAAPNIVGVVGVMMEVLRQAPVRRGKQRHRLCLYSSHHHHTVIRNSCWRRVSIAKSGG